MDLSDLPVEMIETIASYLSVDDICACSKVNIGWRKAFNSNRIWKKCCTLKPNYFMKQKSQMNYTPDVDGSEDCEAKETFFKEVFTRDNLTNGNFHTALVKCGYLYCDSVFDAIDDVGNHWLFISCMSGSYQESKHQLQVWIMNEDPKFHTCIDTAFGIVTRMYVSEMKLNGDKLCIAYEGQALVYQFSYPNYELLFLCKVSCDMMEVTSFLSDKKIISFNGVIFGFLYSVSHQIQKSPPSFLVWSNAGVNIGLVHDPSFDQNLKMNERFLENNHPVVNVKGSESNKLVIHYQYYSSELNSRMTAIKIVDVASMTYLPNFFEKRNYLCFTDICRNNVVLFHLDKNEALVSGEFFNIITGDLVYTVQFNMNSLYEVVPNSQDGQLVVLEQNRFVVYDITSKNIVNSFKIPVKVSHMFVLNKNLLLLETASKMIHEVWNFQSGQKLYKLDTTQSLGFEGNCILFSFIRTCSVPPKLIVYKSPLFTYPFYNITNNNVLIITFW
uniref:F-box domain-containing protein n=1 Tax=Graphocephala atropunctata TaxID=36148 RepID=A0A1B6LIU6_9HEMI